MKRPHPCSDICQPVVVVGVVSLKDHHESEQPEEVGEAVTDAVHRVAEAGGTDHVALGVAVLPLPVDAPVQSINIVAYLPWRYLVKIDNFNNSCVLIQISRRELDSYILNCWSG